jgi:hypothetical protein
VANRQDDYRRNVNQKIARIERPDFDGKPAGKPEDRKRKNCPPIEEDEIEFEGADETEAAVALAPGSSERDSCENNSDQAPSREVEKSSAPRGRAFLNRRVIRQVHGLSK